VKGVNHEMHEKHEKVIFERECYHIQGAVFDVYKEMGCGFLEVVYQKCLERELHLRNIPYEAKQELNIYYKNEPLNLIYIPDFICYNKIIVEIKAVKAIAPEHKAQLLNYLKATSIKLGLLVNFGSHPKTQIIRMVK
jgi:GxxExxY protein